MDLREFDNQSTNRHPWETARLKALSTILRPHLFERIKVLDVGCGDGFISTGLFSHLGAKKVTAVDINLSDEQIDAFNQASNKITYTREIPGDAQFDLVLLLDVLEHIKNDAGFLAAIVKDQLQSSGRILITVPAFQSIYGQHDINLGHFRRYHLESLEKLATTTGLKIISSGYLFTSLLIPKYLICTILKINPYAKGIGQWDGGRLLTWTLEVLLNIDNSLLLFLARFGIKLPGLSGWILCEKPE
jgi:SAM-dependent methyltransferase